MIHVSPTRTGSGVLLGVALFLVASDWGIAAEAAKSGTASWYGEELRGRLMANGKAFDPDQFTAASWFYPLGARLCVEISKPSSLPRSVVVTVTDRGPARSLVEKGRLIDLSFAAFRRLASPHQGLVKVSIQPVSAGGDSKFK